MKETHEMNDLLYNGFYSSDISNNDIIINGAEYFFINTFKTPIKIGYYLLTNDNYLYKIINENQKITRDLSYSILLCKINVNYLFYSKYINNNIYLVKDGKIKFDSTFNISENYIGEIKQELPETGNDNDIISFNGDLYKWMNNEWILMFTTLKSYIFKDYLVYNNNYIQILNKQNNEFSGIISKSNINEINNEGYTLQDSNELGGYGNIYYYHNNKLYLINISIHDDIKFYNINDQQNYIIENIGNINYKIIFNKILQIFKILIF